MNTVHLTYEAIRGLPQRFQHYGYRSSGTSRQKNIQVADEEWTEKMTVVSCIDIMLTKQSCVTMNTL